MGEHEVSLGQSWLAKEMVRWRYLWMRWRKWKCVEVGGILEENGILENRKSLAYGGRKRIKEKEKGKEIHKRRYFLGLKKAKLLKRLIPGFKIVYTENISENTEIVRNSSISERLENFTKNQE